MAATDHGEPTHVNLDQLAPAGFAIIVGAAWCTVFVLYFVAAPYGRHDRPGWGPGVPQRLAWLLMELPSLAAFLAGWLSNGLPTSPLSWGLGLVWTIHYGHRTFVYPLLLRPRPGATMKLLLVLMAVVFNVMNGGLNGLFLAQALRPEWDLAATIGLSIAVLGFASNLKADATLRALRRESAGYQIPRGGLYRWVSCPNYLSELVEWTGFAIAAASPFGWAFAIFTAANLVPRAVASHHWYRATFPDYPRERRAIIPYLL